MLLASQCKRPECTTEHPSERLVFDQLGTLVQRGQPSAFRGTGRLTVSQVASTARPSEQLHWAARFALLRGARSPDAVDFRSCVGAARRGATFGSYG